MPWTEKQRRAAFAAISGKKGKLKRKPNKAVTSMMKSMTLEELQEFAHHPIKKKKHG